MVKQKLIIKFIFRGLNTIKHCFSQSYVYSFICKPRFF